MSVIQVLPFPGGVVDDFPWIELTFGGSTSSIYGVTVYEAEQSVTGVQGQMIEMQCYSPSGATFPVGFGIGNGSDDAAIVTTQTDGRVALRKVVNNTLSSAAINAVDADNVYDNAPYLLKMLMVLNGASSEIFAGENNLIPVGFGTTTNGLVGQTLTPFLVNVDTVSGVRARYRVISI